jgi:hypothetical protein
MHRRTAARRRRTACELALRTAAAPISLLILLYVHFFIFFLVY